MLGQFAGQNPKLLHKTNEIFSKLIFADK